MNKDPGDLTKQYDNVTEKPNTKYSKQTQEIHKFKQWCKLRLRNKKQTSYCMNTHTLCPRQTASKVQDKSSERQNKVKLLFRTIV